MLHHYIANYNIGCIVAGSKASFHMGAAVKYTAVMDNQQMAFRLLTCVKMSRAVIHDGSFPVQVSYSAIALKELYIHQC
jgi:hypothetical protein